MPRARLNPFEAQVYAGAVSFAAFLFEGRHGRHKVEVATEADAVAAAAVLRLAHPANDRPVMIYAIDGFGNSAMIGSIPNGETTMTPTEELAQAAAKFAKPGTDNVPAPATPAKARKEKPAPMTRDERAAARAAKRPAKPTAEKAARKAEKAGKADRPTSATTPAPKTEKAASGARKGKKTVAEKVASAIVSGPGVHAFTMDTDAYVTGWKQIKGHMTQTHKGWEVDTWKEVDAWQAVLTNQQGVTFRGVGETFRKAIKNAAAKT